MDHETAKSKSQIVAANNYYQYDRFFIKYYARFVNCRFLIERYYSEIGFRGIEYRENSMNFASSPWRFFSLGFYKGK